ncbi:hypothetical protein [Rhodoblastus sp.]|jgi:hypothetical protein|uniref:hypothetical protein n=1 Tax=Rhodoblastus sp. TaxID=1962975 RepID=UPI0025EDA6C6|nr:hypothetical protein [Rhodoblastus sp.]
MVILDRGSRSKGLKLRCGSAHQSAGCSHRDMYDYRIVEMGVIHGLGEHRAQLSMAASITAKATEDALNGAVLKLEGKEAELSRLIDLVQQGVAVPQVVDRMRLLGDEVAALKRAAELLKRDRAETGVADPGSDVDDIGAIYRALADLTSVQRFPARAEMRENLTHLIEKVIVGPSGFISHHKDGTGARTVKVGRGATARTADREATLRSS